MSDLVEFLRARLDEDEAVARESVDDVDPDLVSDMFHGDLNKNWIYWRSMRDLREVEAKRRILWLYEGGDAYERSVMDAAAEALAAIYADHPDYRDEWKP